VPAAVLLEAFISKTLVNNLTYAADAIMESIFRSVRLGNRRLPRSGGLFHEAPVVVSSKVFLSDRGWGSDDVIAACNAQYLKPIHSRKDNAPGSKLLVIDC
jgi:hypothetical protein